MKNIAQPFILILCIFLLTSCEKLVLGPDANNNPINNFELFWNDFDLHYGLFGVRGTNWDAVYTTYQPQVTAETTDNELWTIFSEMIEILDDSHTVIFNPTEDNLYISGNAEAQAAEDEFSLDLVEDKYLEKELTEAHNYKDIALVAYSQIKNKDIGYLYMNDMANDADFEKLFDELKDYKAIIIDLRLNHGGTDEYGAEWASYFADGEHLVYTVETRNGPEHNDFDEKISYSTKVREGEQYLKPVIVLTDKYTVSAAEVFLLYIKAFAHVTQIGNNTSGDFSDVSPMRFLPNGWNYVYSSQKFLLTDGSSLDGIGHTPEVFIKNTKADIEAGNDLVLERAIQYLFEEYGIE